MQNYYEDLKIFQPSKNGENIDITVPVIMDMNYGILKLSIIPNENGYTVCDDGKNFSEFSHSAKYYYDLFMKKNKNLNFDIKLDGETIYKNYPDNFNVIVAVNEFIRFFVYLDDFILKNNI